MRPWCARSGEYVAPVVIDGLTLPYVMCLCGATVLRLKDGTMRKHRPWRASSLNPSQSADSRSD